MDREITQIENPTLQLKLQKLYARPVFASLRKDACSSEYIVCMKNASMPLSRFFPSESGAQLIEASPFLRERGNVIRRVA